uniref:Fas associated factor 1 n=1 Tax=Rousettus aegyptiacus TaxID=9407 RepID=A0A7J8K837_ROUAE|nr:Fas associated factor 1 [Rousettus aegyptiacus]
MILADFQACTGIENIDEAITLLEQNNWDLVAAINGVIPQENGILQSDYGGETIPGPAFDPASHPAPSPAPSSSSAFRPVIPSRQIIERQPRMLDFRVEYRDRNVDVVLEDSCTVGEIKQILENELQIPVSKMLLKGWKTGDVEDSMVLKSLHLPKNNSLYVLTPDLPPPSSSSHSGGFQAEFSSRYGDCHPVFFIGSLEAAFQEAFYVKARDRKLLAIYLHHDESVLTNVFCSQMLCAESIVSYLSQNFITWAWDLTKDANRARFLTMCNRHFGSVVAQTIRTQKTDQFPLFLIIMGKRSSNEVLNVIQGNTTVDELMMRLMAAMEIFTAQQQEDIKDEDEREARENVKREQDEAYRLSLEADRAKREAHEREMAEQFRLEQIRKEQEEEREAIRLSLEQALPPEPKEEDAEPVSKLRIRTPSGEFLERRFLASNKLQIVFDFVASKGFPWDEFKLLSTFPRRDITQLDPNKSLLEVKLFPQETLFLEAKE